MFVWSWRNLKHQKCFQITERLNFLKWKRHNFLTAIQENTMNIIACVIDAIHLKFLYQIAGGRWKDVQTILHSSYVFRQRYGSTNMDLCHWQYLMKILYQHKNCWWKYAVHLRPVHVLLSRFNPDLILILSWFYSDFILILSG